MRSREQNEKFNRRQILWVGDKPSSELFESELEIRVAPNIEQIVNLKSVITPSVCVITQISSALVEECKSIWPDSILLYCTRNPAMDQIRQAINQFEVFRVFDFNLDPTEQKRILFEAYQQYLDQDLRRSLLKQATKQFRELEALNESLEQIVEERTRHIETSQKEEEEKLQKVRTFLKSLKDLGSVFSIEDFLVLLRKDLRKYHRVGDPFLILPSRKKSEIFFFSSGAVRLAESEVSSGQLDLLSANKRQFSQFFADVLGRPVAKVQIYRMSQIILGFEHSLAESEEAVVAEYMQDRLESFAMTIEHLEIDRGLQRESVQWERIFDSVSDALAIIGKDFEVLRSNVKFNHFGKHGKCYKVFAGRNEPCVGCPKIQGAEKMTNSIRALQREYQVTSYPIKLEHQDSESSVHLYVDVTQSKELYLRLLQSEKMEAMGLLAGNIAHELNNPLSGIRSLVQVMIKEADRGTQKQQDLIEIEKAAERCQKIIKNLLEFSKGESNQKKETLFDDLVEKTLPMLKSVLRYHKLNLDLKAPQRRVNVEPHLLQQVIFNLVNNACQSMKDGGTLSLSSEYLGDEVVFRVADTGTGIPLEQVDRIFEPFFTTKKEGVGTGLGLSLSRKIIESFGGTLVLMSTSPKGSVFQISLKSV